MAKSIQATITAADNFLNEYDEYKKVQTRYFADQTKVNLIKLQDQGKMLDIVAGKFRKERNEK